MKQTTLLICSILLGIIALWMLYLGYTNSMLPPALTGLGFLVIIWALQTFRK